MRWVFSLALAATAFSFASAFESVRTEPDLTGFHKLGGMHWRPALFLRNLGYEDNIFRAPDADAESDFTATLAPQAEIVSLVRDRAILRARPALFYTAFAEHTDQNFLGGSGNARADLLLNHWSFYGEADYLTTRERPNDEIDLRPRRITRRLALGSRLERAERLALDLQAAQDEIEYKDDNPDASFAFRERLSRRERAARASLAYRAARKTDLVLEAETREHDFTRKAALTRDARTRRRDAPRRRPRGQNAARPRQGKCPGVRPQRDQPGGGEVLLPGPVQQRGRGHGAASNPARTSLGRAASGPGGRRPHAPGAPGGAA